MPWEAESTSPVQGHLYLHSLYIFVTIGRSERGRDSTAQNRFRINRLSRQRFGIEISVFVFLFFTRRFKWKREANGIRKRIDLRQCHSMTVCSGAFVTMSSAYGVHILFVHFLIWFTVCLKQFRRVVPFLVGTKKKKKKNCTDRTEDEILILVRDARKGFTVFRINEYCSY